MIPGWQLIARFILKQRIPILITIVALTVFWGFQIDLRLSQNYTKVIPVTDPDFQEYTEFKDEFGEDGNVMVIGLSGDVFSQEFLSGMGRLTDSLKKSPAVTGVVSIANLVEVVYDTASDKFVTQSIWQKDIATAQDAAALKEKVLSLPFYDSMLINDSLNSTLILVTIDRDRLDTYEKVAIVDAIAAKTNAEATSMKAEPHFSGLPFIRAYGTKKIPKEMAFFLVLAVAITAISLFLFFRSVSAVVIPLMVIGIVVVWGLGVMGLLGYKITILSGVLPALITVIGIPNSIYLITKYHFEFKRTNNKIKSLVLVIQKIGIVTVMTNATTAVGFLVLIFTDISMLREFGTVAGISVLFTFFISLLLLPIIFSFMPPPSRRHVKHTESKGIGFIIRIIDRTVNSRRWIVYTATLGVVVFSVYGLTELQTLSKMMDDVPQKDKIYTDLLYLEDNFNGVMPFEVVVNTHKKQGIFNAGTLKRIEKAQDAISQFPEMSRSISIADLIKFSRQAWLSGVPSEYTLPIRAELTEIGRIYKNSDFGEDLSLKAIFDEDKSKARITAQVQDVGSIRLSEIIDTLYGDLTDIFVRNTKSGALEEGMRYEVYGSDSFEIKYGDKTYKGGDRFTADSGVEYTILSDSTLKGKIDYSDRVRITGTTRIFIKSNDYLVNNLLQSLVIAFVIIAGLMALLFGSPKMVFIALFPNFLPLMLTAGLMGVLNIALKPSSALIFSVAFGIAVDDTIHYLARYRLARKTGDSVTVAVSNSFKDTGVSMIYTSIILLIGFIIFTFSTYGGIQSLGKLTSITIIIALFSNLLLLPSLLRTFHKDDEEIGEGMIDYDEEREKIEALKELYTTENGEDITNEEPEKLS